MYHFQQNYRYNLKFPKLIVFYEGNKLEKINKIRKIIIKIISYGNICNSLNNGFC